MFFTIGCHINALETSRAEMPEVIDRRELRLCNQYPAESSCLYNDGSPLGITKSRNDWIWFLQSIENRELSDYAKMRSQFYV